MNRDYPAKPRRRVKNDQVQRGGSKERDAGQPSCRLFFAVDIPEEAVQELVSWQQHYLVSDRALRLTPDRQLHITLAFLGKMNEIQREQAALLLDEIVGVSSFETAATGMVGLPRGRTPRVIAAAMEAPAGTLMEIHDRLAAGLVEKNLYDREKRPYFPHVTIARARGKTHIDLTEIKPDPVKFTAVRVTLYNSILNREGALHRALKTVQLI